jgi:hypothetical protein
VLGGGVKNGLIKWAELHDFFFFFPIQWYRLKESLLGFCVCFVSYLPNYRYWKAETWTEVHLLSSIICTDNETLLMLLLSLI